MRGVWKGGVGDGILGGPNNTTGLFKSHIDTYCDISFLTYVIIEN